MPQIQEYGPETEAQGPVGGLDPKIEASTLFGRSMEDFGQAVTQAGDLLYRRQVQKENAQTYSQFAQGRNDWTQKLQQQYQDGTLDVDQFKQDYQDYVDKNRENVSTAGGSEFYDKHASYLGEQLLTKATAYSTQLASDQMMEQYNIGAKADENSVMNDPSTVDAVQQGRMDLIDAQVKAGGINPKLGEKMKLKATQDIASSAIIGLAQQDPDKAQAALNSGNFDKYFDPNQKLQMSGKINQERVAQTADRKLKEKQDKDDADARAEEWKQTALPLLVGNKLTAKQVLAAPDLDSAEKYQWIRMIDTQAREDVKTNPAVRNNLLSRMTLPEGDPKRISDPSQLVPYVGKGISTQDFSQLNGWFDKTPQGQVLNTNRKMLLDMAKSQIVKPSTMGGLPDPNGQLKLMQFTQDLQHQEDQMRKQGLPVNSLYDAHSPEFFGKKISSYQGTLQDYTAAAAEQARQASAPGTAANTPADDTVLIVAPDGTPGRIPKANLPAALKRGAKVK